MHNAKDQAFKNKRAANRIENYIRDKVVLFVVCQNSCHNVPTV